MPAAVSVVSSRIITPKGLARVMQHLGAEVDTIGTWVLERNGHVVEAALAPSDLEDLTDQQRKKLAEALGAPPKSLVVLMFDVSADAAEYRMARAVAVALAELWPVVFDDHAGKVDWVDPPRRARG